MIRLGNAGRCALAVSIVSAMGVAWASEGGTSVYPAGVETVSPGRMPGTGETLFLEFNNFYVSNAVVGGAGQSLVPGFHLRVAAVAPKVVHNWGLRVLGGELVSSLALPVVTIHLDAPFGKGEKTGLANPDIGVAAIACAKGNWRWWYGVDAYTPGAQFTKGALINVGQHNFATAPEGAFTWLPNRGRTAFSSKVQYIVNFADPATQYRSGNEFIWEYDASRNITKKFSAAINGDYYQQTGEDTQNGVLMSGTRGRSVLLGPQFKYHAGRAAFILKYQKEMLVQNRTRGSSFWLQIGIPLGHRE